MTEAGYNFAIATDEELLEIPQYFGVGGRRHAEPAQPLARPANVRCELSQFDRSKVDVGCFLRLGGRGQEFGDVDNFVHCERG